MKIVCNRNAYCDWLHQLPARASIGFVPTMGNLHDGHMALIQRALRENQHTVVSVFVNPHQFNDPSDFTHYPRTESADCDKLHPLGVDICLLPDVNAIYPNGYDMRLVTQQDGALPEGRDRPGHFSGMLTVVMKLLQWVKPTRTYFGEKDYDQYQLVQQMVAAFFIETTVVPCAIVRDEQGLALSSRNQRLSTTGLALAHRFAAAFHQPQQPLATIEHALSQLPLTLHYLKETAQRRFVAVSIEGVRLIDNYDAQGKQGNGLF